MRFLFPLRHAGYARHLQSTMRGLCERGHEVIVLIGVRPTGEDTLIERLSSELDALADEVDGLTVRRGPEPRPPLEHDLGGSLRSWLDYLRFLEPEFADAGKLRARASSNLPTSLREPSEAAGSSPEFRAALAAVTEAFEQLLPVPDAVRDLVAEERPDAVVVCPLMEVRTPQVGYLRAAHELGIPTAVCVASWDNLTTSSLLHGDPDRVLVWNEAQRTEAAELHGIPPQRVVATGAPLYDKWFELSPSTSREEFRARVGLPVDRPYVLYVCSSRFIAPEEAEWITAWIEAVRSSGIPELETLPVLVRPHPQDPLLDGSDAAAELEEVPDLVIHPRDGALTILGGELPEYYDSIHHASAVVGINTSAMIESAIAGSSVHVLLTHRYRDTQEGVPHFDHLRSAGGGLVEVRKRPARHAAGLAGAVGDEEGERVGERNRRFLQEFVRPHGLDCPATPLMVDELERLAASDPAAGASPEERLEAAVATLNRIFDKPKKRRRIAASRQHAAETADGQDERPAG